MPEAPLPPSDHLPPTSSFDSRATGHHAGAPATGTDSQATTSESNARPAAAPPQVPGYEVLQVLGRGGMGVVYRARQTALKRQVALKMILAGGHAGPQELARFRTEAEAVARLQHPNIVQIYEIGEHAGLPFFALEYVEGGTLAQRFADGPQAPRPAAEVVETLARAVHHAHERGIVHRDLKPANVLLAAGPGNVPVPKVADFGLAKRLEDEEDGPTRSGAVMGTPSYMAPEQALGRTREVGPACDVYALGAILYRQLTGRPPFQGATALETLEQVRGRDPVPPTRLAPKVPRDLETICLKCLQKEPRRRYHTALELAEDLRRFLDGRPIHARPVSVAERVVKAARRQPVVASLVLLVIVVAAVGFAWTLAALHAARIAEGQANANALAEKAAAERANTAGLVARWNAYIEGMNRAGQTLDEGDVASVRDLLSRNRPAAEQEDLRGFEWYHLWQRCHTEKLSLPGPLGRVRSLQVSRGGKLLAFCEEHGRVRLWDLEEGQERAALPGANEGWFAMALSPDGRLLAAGTAGRHESNRVQVWDLARGERKAALGQGDPVLALAFAPDGATLLVGRAKLADAYQGPGDRFLRVAERSSSEGQLLDVATGQVRAVLPLPGAGALSAAFSPTGKVAALGSSDGAVTLWDAATGKPAGRLQNQGQTSYVYSLDFSPDGKTLVSGGGAYSAAGEVRFWDVETGKETRSLVGRQAGLFCLAFSPDGSLLATGSFDRTVKLWDVRQTEPRPAGTLTGHLGPVLCLAFSPDGRTLATGGRGTQAGGELKLWDVARQINVFPNGAVNTERGLFASISRDRRTVTLATLAEGPRREWQASERTLTTLTFSRDGKLLATADEQTTRLWETETGRLVRELSAPCRVAVRFCADGRTLAVDQRFWDLATGQQCEDPARRPDGTELWNEVRWSYRGANAALSVGDATGRVRAILPKAGERNVVVVDTTTGLERRLESAFPVLGLQMSPDGKSLAVAGNEVHLWDLETGQVRAELKTGGVSTPSPRCLAFSHDGRWLATAAVDATVRLFDVATGKPLHLLQGHTDVVWTVEFAPDDRRLVSSGWDGTCKLWEPELGHLLATYRGTSPILWDSFFSGSGRELVIYDRLTYQVFRAASPESVPADAAENEQAAPEVVAARLREIARKEPAPPPAPGKTPVPTEPVAAVDRTALYPYHVGLAAREWEAGRVEQAERHLRECDPQLRLWEWHYLHRLCQGHCLTLPGNNHRSIAFSPDGSLIAGGYSREVRLSDAATGRTVRTWKLAGRPGDPQAGSLAAFTPDGRRLAVNTFYFDNAKGSLQTSVLIWDVKGDQEPLAIALGPGELNGLVFSPNGLRLAVSDLKGSTKVFDTATGKEIVSLEKQDLPVFRVWFSADGKKLMTLRLNGLREWDPETGKQLGQAGAPFGFYDPLTIAPGGKQLALPGPSGSLDVYQVGTMTASLRLPMTDPVRRLALSPDGKRLAFATERQSVWIGELGNWNRRVLLGGHGSPILGLEFNPAGDRLASLDQQGTVKIWDATTDPEAVTWTAKPGNSAGDLAFSPDGKRLAAAMFSRVLVRDTVTGEITLDRSLARRMVRRIAFSPDGRWLAAGLIAAPMDDLAAVVWDTATGEEKLRVRDTGQHVTAIAFSPDGGRLLLGRASVNAPFQGRVQVWDVAGGKEVWSRDLDRASVLAAGYGPDGKTLAVLGADRTLRLLDGADGQERFRRETEHGPSVGNLAFTPDGKRLVSAGGTAIQVWDSTNLQWLRTFQSAAEVNGLALSPDGRRVVTATTDSPVTVWDLGTGREVLNLRGHRAGSSAVAFSPDGRLLATAGRTDQAVKLWDGVPVAEKPTWRAGAPGKTEAVTVALESSVWSLAFRPAAADPDMQMLVTGEMNGTVRTWEPRTGKPLFTLPGGKQCVYGLAFSPDGKRLACASSETARFDRPGEVRIWDVTTRKEIVKVVGTGGFTGIAFSPDGGRLAAGFAGDAVIVWDGTGKEIQRLKGITWMPGHVAFSPDGKRILATGTGVAIWDEAGVLVRTFTGHAKRVESAEFSPDGLHVVSADQGGVIKLWAAETGKEVWSTTAHAEMVSAVAFSPKGKLIATGGYDKAVKVWDAGTGKERAKFQGHTGIIRGVAFAPDGKRVASAGLEGTVRIWELPPEAGGD